MTKKNSQCQLRRITKKARRRKKFFEETCAPGRIQKLLEDRMGTSSIHSPSGCSRSALYMGQASWYSWNSCFLLLSSLSRLHQWSRPIQAVCLSSNRHAEQATRIVSFHSDDIGSDHTETEHQWCLLSCPNGLKLSFLNVSWNCMIPFSTRLGQYISWIVSDEFDARTITNIMLVLLIFSETQVNRRPFL